MLILLIRSAGYWYPTPSGALEAEISTLIGAVATEFESTASLKVFLFIVKEEMQQWEGEEICELRNKLIWLIRSSKRWAGADATSAAVVMTW